MSTEDGKFYATGKRKNAIARVWMSPGRGQIQINHRPFEEYFVQEAFRRTVDQVITMTNAQGKFNFYILVTGGGLSGQSEAIRHGMAKVMQVQDPSMRQRLKKAGYLTRDSREKERKKYGQKGARARYQYSKR
jgi:small subunit ribosomal protein S9